MKQWDVTINRNNHTIIFKGCQLSGKAKILIDDKPKLYSPFLVRNIGMFYPFEIDGSEIILKLDLNNDPIGLIIDGQYIDTGLPMEEEAITILKEISKTNNPTVKKEQAGMGSFLTFVILSFLNPILMLINSPLAFPFSAFIPQVLMATALYGYEEEVFTIPSMVTFIILSFLASAIFLILYLLGKKRTWPIIVAFILVCIDTLVLVLFSLENVTESIIDIVFHVWVIGSFISLIKNRSAMDRKPLENKDIPV